jgi:hypothetical protein
MNGSSPFLIRDPFDDSFCLSASPSNAGAGSTPMAEPRIARIVIAEPHPRIRLEGLLSGPHFQRTGKFLDKKVKLVILRIMNETFRIQFQTKFSIDSAGRTAHCP